MNLMNLIKIFARSAKQCQVTYQSDTVCLECAAVASRRMLNELYEKIKHGDEKHRAWLREAIVAHGEGRDVPPMDKV